MNVRPAFLACIFFILSACAATPEKLSSEEAAIRVYREAPNCKFEMLGLVSASSGSVGMDIEGNEEASLSKLKKSAYQMGADAVILRDSKFGDRQWHSSGVVHYVSGDAIKGCAK